MKLDKFVVAIVLSVALAYLFPQGGVVGASVLEVVTTWGVALIFFLYGLKLNLSELRHGLSNWRLHILVQAITFLVFPALIYLLKPLITQFGADDHLWIGFLFLAALPSTVSSSVVMVSLARGNVPAAIFNASISGLIGILLTPMWMGANTSTGDAGFLSLYLQLITEILLPLIAGMLVQPWLRAWVLRHKDRLAWYDKSIILLIIYKSFSASFSAGLFKDLDWSLFAMVCIVVCLLFTIVYFFSGKMAQILRFSVEDKIALQFCGTKKSFVHATVFSKILFAGSASLGLILLPIMVYHVFQLFMVGILAERYNRRPAAIQ